LIQIQIHGAYIIQLDCDYDQAFDLCQEACARFGWYNRNTAVNPFTGEGKKSAALEIALEMGKAPDTVICPVGDGCIIGGIYKGFADLYGLGLIERIPKLYGVQAAGSAPLVKAFESKSEFSPLKSVHTVADSIAVGYPRDAYKALRAVSQSGGAMIAVSDEEILAAQRALAQVGGIFAEPAASASYAGLLRLVDNKSIGKNEAAVVLLTGHGLKDTGTAAKNVTGEIEIISPDIESVAKKISGITGL
jgi:threonine synthase